MTFRIPKSGIRLASIAACLTFSNLSVAQTILVSDVHGYTINADREMVEFSALQFSDGKVDKLYSAGDVLPKDSEIVQIDGQGKTLLSGLVDAHGHILSYGLSLLRVDLTGTQSELTRQQPIQLAARSYAMQRAALLAHSSITRWI